MRAADILKIALRNTVRARRRSFLAALAVSIGVASVILVASVGNGSRLMIDTELSQMGVDGLTVYKQASGNKSNKMSADTADFIAKRIQDVQYTMPYMMEYGSFRMRGTGGSAVVLGIGDNLVETLNIELMYGRTPNATDIRYASNVAVVDDAFARKLYKRENIVGKTFSVTLGGSTESFRIIGVISSQKNLIDRVSGGKLPDFVYIPYTRVAAMTGGEGVDQIAVRCFSSADTGKAGEDIRVLLNKYRGAEGIYKVENISGYMDEVRNITGLVALLITAVGAISLGVAGVGVMNTMLSSIANRKREIGIYLAVGATRRDIVICFLLEAVFLCVAGGLAGIAAGLGLAYIGSHVAGIPVAAGLREAAAGLGVSTACGVLFGITPAVRASRMEPIDALRDE